MSTKLFIGNLSFKSTQESLTAAFSEAGTVVSATIMLDKFSGRSRGFGFVEMSTPEEAEAAIALWNEKELDGRTIIVNIARPLEERAPRREGSFPRREGGFSPRREGGFSPRREGGFAPRRDSSSGDRGYTPRSNFNSYSGE